MRITTIILVAFRALLRNPTRAVLTMLGIIIGIAAVITMMEIGAGSASAMRKTVEDMGASNILIMPGAARTGAVNLGSGSGMSLTPQDCDILVRRCDHLSNAAPIVSTRSQMIYGNKNWTPQQMTGTSPAFLDIRKWPMAEGDFFTDYDVQASATVCVLGATIVRELFDGHSPVGQTLRIKNVSFKVIGVLAAKGASMMGYDQDDIVLTPWTTMRQRVAGSRTSSGGSSTQDITTSTVYPGGAVSLYPAVNSTQRTNARLSPRFVYVDQILADAISPEDTDQAMSEITEVLRERHKLRPDDPDDFRMRNSAEMLKMLTSTGTLMANLLLGVALISLVVGGVGIMNIMMVSVTERTREIGLRMAIGARSRDILQQFLVEAVVLCLAGGAIGILLGHGAALLVEAQLRWPIEASPAAVIAAFAVSAAVGIVFGFYPAWKASRLDPIEALRYE